MKKIFIFLFIFLFLTISGDVLAHQPKLIYSKLGDIKIDNPEISQAFYDELKGSTRNYFINSDKDFHLYINLLVPEMTNMKGRYSAKVFMINLEKEEKIAELDADSLIWQEFYEPFGRDYYLKGPELEKIVPAGKYKIEVYSKDNLGKYILAVGKKEFYDIKTLLNVYWQIPLLKLVFFKTPISQFFLTPFGIGAIALIGGLLILLSLIYYFIGFIKKIIKQNQAKTLLLTSSGMPQMKDEIIKLLQKPAYNVNVAFITTAAKPQEDLNYVKEDWNIMKEELGFNVEEIDIDSKSKSEVKNLLEPKDIIYVEGGNAFYLLNSMRKCGFEKIIRKLLKQGKVYIGASAGSIVAGKTIRTASWLKKDYENNNFLNLKDIKGLNLVPFDIVVHYKPEDEEIIRKKNFSKWIKNKIKILTDDQAILVQGNEIVLIGEGEEIII